MLTAQAMPINSSGDLEFPSPRKSPLMALKPTIKTVPAEQMRTYSTVLSIASAGTFIKTAISLVKITIIVVITTVTKANSRIAPPTVRAARSLSFAPTA